MKTHFRKNPILNLILDTDGYKITQYKQYPPDTNNIFSYVEARGPNKEIRELYNRFFPGEETMVVYFGLQYFLKEYMSTPITHADIDQAGPILRAYGNYDWNEQAWRTIVDEYDGWLPLQINSVREGSVIPISNILSHVKATDDRFQWLVSYLETAWMRATWYPCTVASNAYLTRRILTKFMDDTADYEPAEIDYMMNDFGARGVNVKEGAGVGGMSFLVYFRGTDTITGVLYAMEYYDTEMPGNSVDASEHSTITSWGKEHEDDAFANFLKENGKDDTIIACVSDSYGIAHGIENWRKLKKQVIEFGSRGGRLVVRPDSDDPVTTPVWAIEELMSIFGHYTNSKGYKVLPDYIRVLQGDGINLTSMGDILDLMESKGLSASNIVFGRGAGTLQLVDRDTYGFAMKASARQDSSGLWHDVWKESPGKASKRGLLTLVQDRITKKYRTIGIHDAIDMYEVNALSSVYRNGPMPHMYTNFHNVRSEAMGRLNFLAKAAAETELESVAA